MPSKKKTPTLARAEKAAVKRWGEGAEADVGKVSECSEVNGREYTVWRASAICNDVKTRRIQVDERSRKKALAALIAALEAR